MMALIHLPCPGRNSWRYRAVLGAALWLTLTLLGAGSLSFSQEPPALTREFRPRYQIAGYAPGDRFSGPEGIVVDESNRVIYVADTGNGRVVGLSLQGVPKFQLKLEGIPFPRCLATDPAGQLFVSDRDEPLIAVVDTQGKMVRKLDLSAAGARPLIRGLAATSNGRLYVGDAAAGHVLVCDTEGHVLQRIGSSGDREGQLKAIEAVALDQLGRLYVLDSAGVAVNVFDQTGHFSYRFGRLSVSENDLLAPVALYVDRQDQLWIVDQEAHAIYVYAEQGVRRRQFGGAAHDPLLLLVPSGLAMDRLGNVYVVEKGADRVQVFGLDRPFLPFDL